MSKSPEVTLSNRLSISGLLPKGAAEKIIQSYAEGEYGHLVAAADQDPTSNYKHMALTFNGQSFVISANTAQEGPNDNIEVESAKHHAFKEVLGTPVPLKLTDYGAILYSGWGTEPSDDLKQILNEKYGLYESM